MRVVYARSSYKRLLAVSCLWLWAEGMGLHQKTDSRLQQAHVPAHGCVRGCCCGLWAAAVGQAGVRNVLL